MTDEFDTNSFLFIQKLVLNLKSYRLFCDNSFFSLFGFFAGLAGFAGFFLLPLVGLALAFFSHGSKINERRVHTLSVKRL